MKLTLHFLEKQSASSALVHVMKATILEPQCYSLVKSKLVNKCMVAETMMFNGIGDLNFETPDLVFNNVTSRKVYIPVLNNTNENITLKRGTCLGHVVEVAKSCKRC